LLENSGDESLFKNQTGNPNLAAIDQMSKVEQQIERASGRSIAIGFSTH
jgi:hypothetical protein